MYMAKTIHGYIQYDPDKVVNLNYKADVPRIRENENVVKRLLKEQIQEK